MLEAALVRGLTEGGIDVVLIGMGPSPMLYFATHYLDVDGGIQVTGSHNPADYNGFKLLLKGRSVFGAGDPGDRPPRRRGDWTERQRHDRGSRHPRSLCRPAAGGLLGQGLSASAGTPATARRGRSSTCWSSGCPGSIMRSSPTSTAASPTTIPIRRSRRTSPTSSGSSPTSSSISESPSTATATVSARSTARAG